MKTSHAVLAGAVTVALGAIGARYFGGSFKLIFLGFLVVAYIVVSILLRQQEKGLAQDLKLLGKEDQDDMLSRLEPRDQERVRRDMQK